MGEYKVSSEKQNSKAAPIQAPKEVSTHGEMKHEDSRGSTFQLAQLQAKADDRGSKSNITQLQAKALNFSGNSQLAQLQDKGADQISSSQSLTVQRQENKTGLPDGLKSGMESLSGMSLSDVKVHRNSDKPAQLQAHAYAQGTDIHLGPGQEKHLPHELGHVVQQKEGRVKPTTQLKSAIPINDDQSLEQEADVMGAKALHLGGQEMAPLQAMRKKESTNDSSGIVQRKETIAPLEGEVKGVGTLLKNTFGGGTIYTNLKKKVDLFNAADEVGQVNLGKEIVILSNEWKAKHPNPESKNDKNKLRDINRLIGQLAESNSKTAEENTVAGEGEKKKENVPRTAEEEAEAREEFKINFKKEFLGQRFLNFGGSFQSVEDTADLVYDKLAATLAITKSAMGGLTKIEGTTYDELATKGDRYKKSSTGNTKVASGITPEYKAALKLAESFANELKDLTKQNNKAKKLAEKGFAFWSGNPAKKAAGASGLVSLEGSSLGGIFENTKLPEGVDMSIWGSVSKAYAEWATEETAGKKYHGYVGLGGDRLDSIYNSVERWAVEGATSGKPTFRIQWLPVIPEESAYQEAEAAGEKWVAERYNKSPISLGGSDVTSKGLPSRAQAEQMMLEADAERKNKVKNP